MSQHGWGVTCERGTSHLEGSLRKPQKALEKPRAEDLGVRQSPSATLEKRLPLGEKNVPFIFVCLILLLPLLQASPFRRKKNVGLRPEPCVMLGLFGTTRLDGELRKGKR